MTSAPPIMASALSARSRDSAYHSPPPGLMGRFASQACRRAALGEASARPSAAATTSVTDVAHRSGTVSHAISPDAANFRPPQYRRGRSRAAKRHEDGHILGLVGDRPMAH